MPFNRYENVSTANPMPVQEVAGTYNAKEPISASNPLPVMEVEGSYTNYETVSSSNPQPIAIISDSGTYTRTEEYSDTNAFPIKFITGQTYDPRFDVSETNPWPVVVVSGGEEAYTTAAVHFDGADGLSIASLDAIDSEHLSFVFWIKAEVQANTVLFVVDPDSTYTTIATLESRIVALMSNIDSTASLEVGTDGATGTQVCDSTWHCVIFSANTLLGIGEIWIGNEYSDYAVIPGDPFSMTFDGLPFKVCDDGFGQAVVGDIADFRFMPGISLLDGEGEIPLATRRLFIDENGKPVDPAVATAALGAPAILFKREPAAAASTFGNNLGTGGAFTITGTLTNALTSPSD